MAWLGRIIFAVVLGVITALALGTGWGYSTALYASLAVAVFHAGWLVIRLWLRRREPDGEERCQTCGYILRGLTEQRCPECGQSIQAFEETGFRGIERRTR